ncbi:endoplasmic reticulum metallopeptidase 1-like [Anopheles darlingi]|uniref:endoplasmic reticulum metallopeptidase 1-like n=1 Tax=Anopheles darlingi TaxID=43151 RepID=UPI0021004719|nr:endoplasmic reticulum metallopeptidase 1-like [Anopheles darlingi]XP_049530244.1 endoplasmic reticulum metallopeptidase 1-like [Anopheles darlingi]
MSPKAKQKTEDPSRASARSDESATNLHQLDAQYGVLGIVLLLFCGTVSSYLCTLLPDALTSSDLNNHPTAFIAERAWESLQVLNDFGPKPTGSVANELRAAEYLRREIEKLKATKHAVQQIETDHQIVSGAYSIGFQGHPLTSVYRRAQNLVAKLVGEGAKHGDPALMLNCHYDTVASSPGASDDGGSCVVMLEILRVLSRSPERTRHSIIFLFNGAEETPLQAAHGFISQHRWAKEVRAFLNLESAGSGGKEQLFQSGPQHPWLVAAYARAIRHPAGQVFSEELFHSGLIPSDTDFRIFRDFGHVPGMDFAHSINGYRYHTRFDNIDFLTLPVLQRTGDNILALTREIANGDDLAMVDDDSRLADGHSVYFDFLGFYFFHYSSSTGQLLNYALALLALVLPYAELLQPVRRVGGFGHINRQVMAGFLGTIVGTMLSVAVVLIIANRLDAIGRAMAWYSTPYLILGVYGCPVMLIHCFSQRICNHLLQHKETSLNLAQIVRSRLLGVNLFWAVAIVYLTIANIRSAYIPAVILLCSVLSSLTISLFSFQRRPHRWLGVHLAFQAVAMLWSTNFYHLIMKLFVPITGRIGGTVNPEYLIGLLVAIGGLLCISYLVPLIGLLKQSSELTARLTVFAMIGFLLACCTQVGFPYRDDSNGEPSVQRHYVTHTLQVTNGSIDSGYLLREMDRNAVRVLRGIAKPHEITPMRQLATCKTMPFCGIPFYSVWHQIRFDHYWLEGPPPSVELDHLPTLVLEKVSQVSVATRRYAFHIGHHHQTSVQSALVIVPRPGVRMIKWSLMDTVPEMMEFNGQRAYFVLITYGLAQDSLWNITFDFEYDPEAVRRAEEPLVAISWINTFWECKEQHTTDFRGLIEKFPEWAHVIPSVAVVNITEY